LVGWLFVWLIGCFFD